MQRVESSLQSETLAEPLVEELENYRQQFERIKQDAGELLAGLTEAEFNWRLAPGSWSIGECLAHLNVTGSLYLPQIDEQLGSARARGLLSRGPFRHGFIGNFIVKSTEPPVKLKVKHPKAFAPPPDQPMAEVSADFMTLQDEFIKRLSAANGLDLARVKLYSPITKLLKLSLGQFFGLTAAHERRHLWQARQVLEKMRAEG